MHRTLLLSPFVLADVAQPKVLALLDSLRRVNVAQLHQLLPNYRNLQGVLGQQIIVGFENLWKTIHVRLKQLKKKSRVVFKNYQSELPQNVVNLKGGLHMLLLPHNVMVKLFGKQSEIDGVPHEVNEGHLKDTMVLLKVEPQFAGVQF